MSFNHASPPPADIDFFLDSDSAPAGYLTQEKLSDSAFPDTGHIIDATNAGSRIKLYNSEVIDLTLSDDENLVTKHPEDVDFSTYSEEAPAGYLTQGELSDSASPDTGHIVDATNIGRHTTWYNLEIIDLTMSDPKSSTGSAPAGCLAQEELSESTNTPPNQHFYDKYDDRKPAAQSSATQSNKEIIIIDGSDDDGGDNGTKLQEIEQTPNRSKFISTGCSNEVIDSRAHSDSIFQKQQPRTASAATHAISKKPILPTTSCISYRDASEICYPQGSRSKRNCRKHVSPPVTPKVHFFKYFVMGGSHYLHDLPLPSWRSTKIQHDEGSEEDSDEEDSDEGAEDNEDDSSSDSEEGSEDKMQHDEGEEDNEVDDAEDDAEDNKDESLADSAEFNEDKMQDDQDEEDNEEDDTEDDAEDNEDNFSSDSKEYIEDKMQYDDGFDAVNEEYDAEDDEYDSSPDTEDNKDGLSAEYEDDSSSDYFSTKTSVTT